MPYGRNRMKSVFLLRAALAVLFIQLVAGRSARADEGLWLFTDPPRKQLKERYNFELTDAWLDHVRLATVRFAGGGTGSFVSSDGLILTNHHIIDWSLHELTTKEKDYLRDGFVAHSWEQEVRCPDL